MSNEILSRIQSDFMPLVNAKILAALASDSKTISDIANYLFNLGGKRLRPLLIILSAQLFKQQTPTDNVITACAAIEMIHLATLLHDDIIDQSSMRRGHESAYKRFGLNATLLAGDFLLVRAFGTSGSILDKNFVVDTERACVALTEGEELEGTITGTSWKSYDEYLDVIEKKTAALFALACASGAYFAGAPEGQIKNIKEFGHEMGIAFQMIDDILDIAGDEKNFGKPLGIDLKQRTPSLINILWLESGDKKAVDFFNTEDHSPEEISDTVRYLRYLPVMEEAKQFACQHIEKAKYWIMQIDENVIDIAVRDEMLLFLDKTLMRCT